MTSRATEEKERKKEKWKIEKENQWRKVPMTRAEIGEIRYFFFIVTLFFTFFIGNFLFFLKSLWRTDPKLIEKKTMKKIK